MKKIFFVYILVITSIFSSGIKVEILADESYPPYSYVENGELKGIYVDIIKEIDSRLKLYDISLKPVPWNRGINMVDKGLAFAIIPPYYRPKERPNMIYSHSILKEELVVVSLKNKSQNWPLDFLGSKIGLNRGFLPIGNELKKRFIIEEASSSRENLKKLLDGRIDYYINDRYSIQWELNNKNNFKEFSEELLKRVSVNAVISYEYGYIGYSLTNKLNFRDDFIEKTDDIIIKMIEEGEIKKIIEKKR